MIYSHLPNKTTFIPTPPHNEHEIFQAMRLYPDNAKIYHPHRRIDATSVFWLNKLHPAALNFAAFVDPKADDQLGLSNRILVDIHQLAWKFNVDRIITRDYAPQHPFNKWLVAQGFRLTEKMTEPFLSLSAFKTNPPSILTTNRLVTASQLLAQQKLWQQVAQISLTHYRQDHPNNPVGEITLADWQALLRNQLIEQVPTVLLDDQGKLASYCLTYRSSKRAILGEFDEVQSGALLTLIHIQLAWLATHESEVKSVALRLKSANQLGLQLYHHFDFDNSPVYETYMQLIHPS